MNKPTYEELEERVIELEKTEDMRKKTEEKYRSLIENIPVVTWTTSEKGFTVYISTNIEKVYGFTQKEVYEGGAESWLGRIHPDDIEEVEKAFKLLFTENKIFDIEYRIQRKDGEWIWALDRAVSTFEKDGEIYADGIFKEITGRKKAENELIRFKAIAENAANGTAIADLKGNFLYVNNYFAEIHGYEVSELSGENLSIFHNEKQLVDVTAINKRLIEEGSYSSLEVWHTHKDGTEFPMLMSGTIIKNELLNPLYICATAIDITERKQAEQALRESEARLSEAQRVAHVGSWELDIKTNELWWSDETYRMFGFEIGEFGSTMEAFFDTVHPDDRPFMQKVTEAAWYEKKPFDAGHRIILPGGEIRTVHEQAEVIFDEAGQPVRMTGTVQDITGRKKTEEEVEKLNSAVEQSTEGIGIVDLESLFTYVNSAFAGMHGYTAEEMIGMSVIDLLSEKEKITHKEAEKEFFRDVDKKGYWDGEEEHVRKDGTTFPSNISVSILKDTEGRSTGLVGICKDITEQKKAEEMLRISEEKFSKAFYNSPVVMGITTLKDGKFREVNNAFKNLTGYARQDVIGRTSLDIGMWANREDREKVINSIQETGSIQNIEVRLKNKSGQIRDTLFSAEILELGPEKNVISSAVDITERKKAEKELEKYRNELEKLVELRTTELKDIERRSSTWLENSPVCTKIVDLDFNLQYMSSSGIRELKIDDITQYYGKPYPFDFYPESFQYLSKKNLEEVKKSDKKVVQETSAVDTEGNKIWYRSTLVPVKDEKNRIIYIMIVSMDITERKKAEERLKLSENRLQQAQKIADIGYWDWLSDTGELKWSPEVYEIFGQDRESFSVSAESFEACIHPEDLESFLKERGKFLDESSETIIERRIIRPDGEVRYVEERAELIRDNSGNIVQVAGTVQDITKRRKAEEALRESENLYKSLVETSFDGIVLTDLNGEYIFCNQMHASLLGYDSASELISKSGFDFIAPEHKEIPKKVLQKLKKEKHIEGINFEMVRKNGSRMNTELSATIISDKKGMPNSIMCLMRDITGRRQAEIALQEKQVLNEQLLDSIPHAAMLINKNRKVIVANKIALEVGTKIGDYCWKEFGKCASLSVSNKKLAEKDPDTKGIKCTFCLADQCINNDKISNDPEVYAFDRFWDTYWVPLGDGETYLHYSIDVTERREAEEALAETKKNLEQSERLAATCRLAASIAHEINNPAQAISFNLGFIKNSLPADFKEKEAIKQIETGLMRIKNTVRQLLGIHKSKVKTEERIDVNEIIKSTLSLMQNQLVINNIEVKQSLNKKNHFVYGSSQELFQVFMNLIGNAQDAMKDGGVINISTRIIKNKMKLVFSDNGMGIAKKDIGRIFEPFYTTKSAMLGTGLGLSTSKGIIENMGGDITVTSAEGKGAVFTITLPVVKEKLRSK